MNPLYKTVTKGAFGELLVQIRLLQSSVQAMPPLKDSGNDLIAIRGEVFRAIQVKTTTSNRQIQVNLQKLPKLYHILAIVWMNRNSFADRQFIDLKLDQCRIFLLKKEEVRGSYSGLQQLANYELSKDRIDMLFSQ